MTIRPKARLLSPDVLWNMPKMTPWFDAHKQSPVHRGAYQFITREGSIVVAKWDGDNWSIGNRFVFPVVPGDQWRGLRDRPND